MLEEGYVIKSIIPYEVVTNMERQRRQIRRTRCFLEELGVESVVIGVDDIEQMLHVSGFVPRSLQVLDNVDHMLRQLGASEIHHFSGTRRGKL